MLYERIDEAFAAYHAFVDNAVLSGGGYRAQPDKDMKHWHAIAKMAAKHGVTSEMLISARFAATEVHLRRTLRPSSICRPAVAVEEALRQFVPDRTCDHRKAYDTAKQLISALHSRLPMFTMDNILEDPNQAFPAWFRVLHMSALSDMVRNCYLEEAKEEYRRDVGLQTFIAETLHGFNAERLA